MSTTYSLRQSAEERLATADWIDETLAGIDDLDAMDRFGTWVYREPNALRDESDEVRRAAALDWLRRHNRGLQAIARRLDKSVDKISSDSEFGLEVFGCVDGLTLLIRATVDAALTCELVPTGETRTIPERTEPVMERRCPESIFAGVESEVLDV